MSQICYWRDNVCFDKQFPWMHGKPHWYCMLLTFLILYFAGMIALLLSQAWYPSTTTFADRFFAISYIWGVLCFVTLIYDTEFLRAISIVLFPMLAEFFAIIITFHINDIVVALIMHLIHFITIGYLFYRQKIPKPFLLLMAGGVWILYTIIVMQLNPSMRMVYCLTMPIMVVSIAISTVLMMLMSFLVHKYASKRHYDTINFMM